MVKLFACEGSGNCMKPWLAMTQLQQDFELVIVDVLKGDQKELDYLNVNPLGVVPFLEIEPGRGIGESNAMLWYLSEGSALMPANAHDRAEALQWMFFEQSKLEPFISPARFFSFIRPDQSEKHAVDIAIWQDLARPGLTRLNEHLNKRQFMLTSGYSIADIALFGYVHVLAEAGLDPADYPMIGRWADDVSQTEGFQPLQNIGRSKKLAA